MRRPGPPDHERVGPAETQRRRRSVSRRRDPVTRRVAACAGPRVIVPMGYGAGVCSIPMPVTRRLRWQWRVAGLATVAAATLAAGASAATAGIVSGQGIAGVKIGDPGAKVQRALGKPQSVQTYHGGQSWFWHRATDKVDWVTVTTKHIVIGLETTSRSEKTTAGVGPGSSLAALERPTPVSSATSGSFLRQPTRFVSCRRRAPGRRRRPSSCSRKGRSFSLTSVRSASSPDPESTRSVNSRSPDPNVKRRR